MTKPKFPVKPIGKILYSELFSFNRDREAEYKNICDCKGWSLLDRPFSVMMQKSKCELPYCVVYHWRNDNYKNKIVRNEQHMDEDTYYMTEILERHATQPAAEKAMRKFASEAFAKVNNPASYGEACHIKLRGEVTINVGDLVTYVSCPGIIWKVKGEVRKNDQWNIQLEPACSFFVDNSTDNKIRTLSAYDAVRALKRVDLLEMGTIYTKLGLLMQDEARRRSE